MPETETEPAFDRHDQPPALGRKGMVLALLVQVLIAAAGFGVVSLISRGSDTQATAVRVPTSDWIPGQTVGTTPIQGALSIDERHCIYLETADQKQLWPVWPAGYTAKLGDNGQVSLYDGKNHLVARDGESVQATGTFASSAAYTGESCLPTGDQVAVVQSLVTALG